MGELVNLSSEKNDTLFAKIAKKVEQTATTVKKVGEELKTISGSASEVIESVKDAGDSVKDSLESFNTVKDSVTKLIDNLKEFVETDAPQATPSSSTTSQSSGGVNPPSVNNDSVSAAGLEGFANEAEKMYNSLSAQAQQALDGALKKNKIEEVVDSVKNKVKQEATKLTGDVKDLKKTLSGFGAYLDPKALVEEIKGGCKNIKSEAKVLEQQFKKLSDDVKDIVDDAKKVIDSVKDVKDKVTDAVKQTKTTIDQIKKTAGTIKTNVPKVLGGIFGHTSESNESEAPEASQKESDSSSEEEEENKEIPERKISITIAGIKANNYDIVIDDAKFRLDDFVLTQQLLEPNRLTFTMHKEPEETYNETVFEVCGEIIGKEVTLDLDPAVKFRGFIASASGSRCRSEFQINVIAYSWDALLQDSPNCKSFENQDLDSIIKDVVDDYKQQVSPQISSQFTDQIPYCVQYNESNYQFLQRLAFRYGEWMYNDGERFVFGKLQDADSIDLTYPSHDITSFNVELQVKHASFAHIVSSYNENDSSTQQGEPKMKDALNTLADKTYDASTEIYKKPTLQNLLSGGYADSDSRSKILDNSTAAQGKGQKSQLLTYTGSTYCSKIKVGSKLTIKDNYITESQTNKKSDVDQDEILVTEITHYFMADETYSNHFVGIPSACNNPPFSNPDIFAHAQSCRAKVTDNEDPNNLGRVRVQFDWQKQLSADMKTPWLRIAQPYAGGGKGFSFIPEVGEEVLIGFEGGNADRPYVEGALYNGKEMPDGDWLPGSNQIKAIRTRNGHTIEIHDEGEGGFIRIYDNEKENYILTFSTDEQLIRLESTGNIELQAQKDIILHAGNDVKVTAENDMVLEAHNDQRRIADNDIREHAGNDRTATIDRNDSLTISENSFVKVNGNKDEKVQKKLQVTANDIRIEAHQQLLEYSTTHQAKASNQMALNANATVEIKAAIVKVQ